jgi:type II secretory pathway pseudopilin PulG
MQNFDTNARRKGRGAAYIFFLFCVAILGLALTVVADVDSIANRREKEKELLFIGRQFRQALKSYYETSIQIDDPRRYPPDINSLLEDYRAGKLRRHLRRLYADPMTGNNSWGTVISDGQILGVHSLSKLKPIKQDNFDFVQASFRAASSYAEWVFSYSEN